MEESDGKPVVATASDSRVMEKIGTAPLVLQSESTRHAAEILEEVKSAEPEVESNEEACATVDRSFLHFIVKYANKNLEVRLSTEDTVVDLKAILYSLTDVPFERQKLLGLVKGKVATDETALNDLQIPQTSLRSSPHPTTGEKRITISLLGTPLDQTFRDPGSDAIDNQLAGAAMKDIDYSDPASWPKYREPRRDPEALSKLRKAISRFSSTFPIMNEPREGLKGGLLVLDLDYTMVDTKRLLDGRSDPKRSERPNLHEFLTAVYPYYDIVVWSQTSHFWLEAKLTELGCLTHEQYKIAFVLDRTPMFSVKTHLPGQPKNKHEVKALEIIWRRFPTRFGPHNTVHIDDLSRNFAMNPNCGLKIKPYRHSPSPDHELVDLQEYLIKLAEHGLKSFEELGGHSRWKKLLAEHKKKGENPP